MGVLSNRIDREQLKPGDHIYSWRKAYIYAHHGIYFGDGMVIHFTRAVDQEVGTGTILDRFFGSSTPRHDPNNPCPRCGDQSKKEGVISSCLDCFLYGGSLCLFEYGVSLAFFLANRGGTCTHAPSDPIEDVLHRASFLLEHGFGGYDLFKENSEDFAIYCKTGLLICSGQAASNSAVADAAGVGAAAAAIFSATIRKMTIISSVSVLATLGYGTYSYCANRMASDTGRRHDAFKIPVEFFVVPPGLNESKNTVEVPDTGLTASPNLNEQEKTTEMPVEMLVASSALNEPEKTAEVPVEHVKASPGLNEPVSPPGFGPHNAHLAAGATNHATVDRENLAQSSKYSGSQRLSVGNGTEAERRKKEEAERLAKLDEIAEKQRQREREVEEKERQRREAVLGRGTEPASRRSEPPTRPPESGSAAAAGAAPGKGKYVPRFKREKSDGRAAPPPETDRWTKSSSKPDGDRWPSSDRRPAFRSSWGSRSSSTWSPSQNQRDR